MKKLEFHEDHHFLEKLQIHVNHVIFLISHLHNPQKGATFNSHFRASAPNPAFFTKSYFH